MKSSSSLPNYKLWPNGDGTALLAVDTGLNPNKNPDPHIHLHFPKCLPGESVELGPPPGPTCVILKVTLSEAFCVTAWSWRHTGPRSFCVGPDFALKIHDPLNPSHNQPMQSRGSHPGTVMVEVGDLESLFSKEWPDWLRPALVAQLRHWRIHHVEHYYHYTPWELSRDDIWRCVKGAPTQALRRFRHRLTDIQRQVCCSKAPRAAAAFAFNTLNRCARRQAIENYPEEVLRHAAHELSDQELMLLAASSPPFVFRCCRCMPGRQRALALSVALNQKRGYFFERPVVSKALLLESLADYPEQWLAGVGGGFETVLTVWADRLGWIPTGFELLEIHRRLDRDHQPAIRQLIAQRI